MAPIKPRKHTCALACAEPPPELVCLRAYPLPQKLVAKKSAGKRGRAAGSDSDSGGDADGDGNGDGGDDAMEGKAGSSEDEVRAGMCGREGNLLP